MAVKDTVRRTIIFDKDVDDKMREHYHKKGDFSKMVNDAIRTVYFMKAPKK